MPLKQPLHHLQHEFEALVNRSVDRQLRLAVTGLSRSGKTAFITGFVNQLLNVHNGAQLPLFPRCGKGDCLAQNGFLSEIWRCRASVMTKA